MPVNNCNGGGDTSFLEVMGNNISDRIYNIAGNYREYCINVEVELPKGFLEKLPVLFGKNKHQRTFSA
jgi:hypothetical protein